MRGRLVEHEHRRVREQRAGDDEPLALAARELAALLADERVEPVAAGARPSRQDPRPPRAPPRSRRRSPRAAPRRTFSRIVVEKRCASWPATAIARRTSSWRYSRRSRPPSVTRPASGSRKRSSRFVTVVLPAPLGPTSATRRPARAGGRRRRARAARRARSARGRPRARPRTAPPASGSGLGRVGDGRLAVGQLEHAAGRRRASRPARARPAASGCTASNDASASSASTAISTRSRSPCGVRRDGDGEHARDRRAGDEQPQRRRRRRRRARRGGRGGRARGRPRASRASRSSSRP